MADRELELAALVRLGLGARIGQGAPPGEPLLEALVRRGAIAAHQAAAVRAFIDRNEAACRCGRRCLAPETSAAFTCPACGAALARATVGWEARPATGRLPGLGSRIGPLELREVLGKGASGTVYVAWHATFHRLSAVKVLPLAALDEKKKKRFEREVEALARLDHPGIVKVHAALQSGTALACEMELVKGGTLEGLVRRRGPLAWREAAEIVAGIAEAVAHAHSLGVVHRDLKPANVLVREEDGAPLVADFGLARLTDQESSLTRVGAILGTPVYMAPEAFSGTSAPSCDVYGIGAILYYVLSGRNPYDELEANALVYKVTRGLAKPLEGVPSGLEQVRRRAMAPDPRGRYASAAELASDLRRLLAGDAPVRAVASRPLAAIALSVAILAGLAAALGLRSEAPPETRARRPRTAIEEAIELLRSGASGTRAIEAQRTLSGPAGLAALDSAVADEPADAGLRSLRVGARRRAGLSVDVTDLEALSEKPEELDALASHALRHGLRGDGPVAKLRGLRARNPSVRSLAALLGQAACGSGDPSCREEAVRALAAARPLEEGQLRLARALAEADALAAVYAGEATKGPDSAAPNLEQDLAVLAREKPAAVLVVLAPVGSAARAALAARRLSDPLHVELPRALLRVLAPARDALPPGIVALYAMLRDLPVGASFPPIESDSLATAGLALVDADPLLAAAALELAAASLVETGRIDDVEKIRSWYAGVLRALEEVPRRKLTEFEQGWHIVVFRRSAKRRAGLEEALASREPERRRAHLEAALGLQREGLAATLKQGLPAEQVHEACNVIRISFELGRFADAEDVLPIVPQADAFRAEAKRRAGDRVGALLLAKRAAAAAPCADSFAALALASADSGNAAAARDALAKLASAEQTDGPTLESFHAGAVEAYVRAQQDR